MNPNAAKNEDTAPVTPDEGNTPAARPNPETYYRDAQVLGRIAKVLNADSREARAEKAWEDR